MLVVHEYLLNGKKKLNYPMLPGRKWVAMEKWSLLGPRELPVGRKLDWKTL